MSTLLPCVCVLAHGEPPAAYAVLSHDAQGARAVRLGAGLALRRAAQRFEFVCPAAWGDQYAAPLAALADGTIVIGATSGLKLLGEDAKVRAHPDPAAAGDSDDVVHGAQGTFALRATPQGSEVLAVDAQKVRVIWQDTKSLYSLAPLDDELLLLRANGTTLEQVTIAADGRELERQAAAVASPVDYVFARAAAGAAYALVVFRTRTALGRLSMNTFSEIAEAPLAIAGPLSVSEGTLLALDGKLSQLVDGGPMPLAENDNVLCLMQSDGLSYACNPAGIARLSARALGEPLFQLSWLVEPNLELIEAGELRDRCNAQWQDLRIDLLAVGTSLLVEGALDAGPLADAAVIDADAREAGPVDAGHVTAVIPSEKQPASCRAMPWQDSSGAANVLVLTLALGFLRRLRRFGADF